VSSVSAERSKTRRWVRRGAALVAAGLLGLGVQACGTSQVAVPAGPGQSTPTTPSKSTSPSTKTSPDSKTKLKPAKPVRPHGNVKQHAQTHKVTFEKRRSVAKTASFSDGVEVSVVKLRGVNAVPIGPGQVGGPAVGATLKIKNGSTVAIDLSTVSVRMLGSDGSPGVLTTGGKADPLGGTLAPGNVSRGTYVFTLDKSLRKPVTLQVEYGSGQTVLQFSGNAG